MAKYIWNIYAIARDAMLRSRRIRGFNNRDLLGLSRPRPPLRPSQFVSSETLSVCPRPSRH